MNKQRRRMAMIIMKTDSTPEQLARVISEIRKSIATDTPLDLNNMVLDLLDEIEAIK